MMSRLLSFIKSLYFCIRVFGLKKGIYVPILIHYKTQVDVAKQSIKLKNFSRFGIRLGFGGSQGVYPHQQNYFIVKEGSSLILDSNILMGAGFSIRVENNSTLVLGKNFNANKNVLIKCSNGITIGEEVLVGWNVEIRDSDGHKVYYEGMILNDKIIKIENQVWIASDCSILGNTCLSNNSVVAMRSLTNKCFRKNSLIAGIPAKEIKEISHWEI